MATVETFTDCQERPPFVVRKTSVGTWLDGITHTYCVSMALKAAGPPSAPLKRSLAGASRCAHRQSSEERARDP